MPFKEEGHFEGPVKQVLIAEPRFNKEDPNAFDVCIEVEGPNGQSDWWRGEMSNKYGVGIFANKRRSEITMDDLRKVGFEGEDLTQLSTQLVGKTIPFSVVGRDHEGKRYFDVKYIGGNDFAPKALDPAELQRRMAAMQSGGSSSPAPSATSSSDSNPW